MILRGSISTLTVLLCVATAACGGPRWAGGEVVSYEHAVGTYIGGGSMITGSDPCEYASDSDVFGPRSVESGVDARASGPRFVLRPGPIEARCPKWKDAITAVQPKGAQIEGLIELTVGDTMNSYSTHFVANGHAINGDGNAEWTLGPDCAGVATFAPVMGSQDTGGPEKHRHLVTTKAGTCTVHVALSTGSESAKDAVVQTFKAELKVTIK